MLQNSDNAAYARRAATISTTIWAVSFASLATLWLAYFFAVAWPDPLGTDFYPVWYGARLALAGENPYGEAALAHLREVWRVPFVEGGLAYPLPALLAAVPFALLPLTLAVPIWLLLGMATTAAAGALREGWRVHALTILLYFPLFRAAHMKQATLIYIGLAVVLVLALRARLLPLAGLCIALLPAKPQNGLLFAVAALVWAWREDRRLFGWAAAWSLPLWLGSLLVMPDWPQAWLAAIARYRLVVEPVSLLPWGLALVAASWRLPWHAVVAAAQVALFPLSDLYGALPLLLGWIAIGGPLAWVGAGISWLWPLLGFPNSTQALWLFVLLPYSACALWRSLQASGMSGATQQHEHGRY